MSDTNKRQPQAMPHFCEVLARANIMAGAEMNDGRSEETRAAIDLAYQTLTELSESESARTFESILVECGVSPVAARHIRESMEATGTTLCAALRAAACAADPENALIAWLERPENAGLLDQSNSETENDEACGKYAPLVAALSAEADAVRARSFGILLAYAASGWLAADAAGKSQSGGEIATGPMLAALRARLGDLLTSLEIIPVFDGDHLIAIEGKAGPLAPRDRDTLFRNARHDNHADAVILGPDGTLATTFVLFGDEVLEPDSRLVRHMKALQHAFPDAAKRKMFFLAPAYLGTASAGNTLGRILKNPDAIVKDLPRMFNPLPFLIAALNAPVALPPGDALAIHLVCAGWKDDVVPSLREAISSDPRGIGRDLRALDGISTRLLETWQTLAEALRIDVVFSTDPSSGHVAGKALGALCLLGGTVSRCADTLRRIDRELEKTNADARLLSSAKVVRGRLKACGHLADDYANRVYDWQLDNSDFSTPSDLFGEITALFALSRLRD